MENGSKQFKIVYTSDIRINKERFETEVNDLMCLGYKVEKIISNTVDTGINSYHTSTILVVLIKN